RRLGFRRQNPRAAQPTCALFRATKWTSLLSELGHGWRSATTAEPSDKRGSAWARSRPRRYLRKQRLTGSPANRQRMSRSLKPASWSSRPRDRFPTNAARPNIGPIWSASWSNERLPSRPNERERANSHTRTSEQRVAKKIHVSTTINGEAVDFLCEARQSLLEVLRDTLHLTGAKEGCNNGNCGACTVLIAGRPVDSCLVLAVEVDGAEIATIEGVSQQAHLHPIQQCFLEDAALQCGVST